MPGKPKSIITFYYLSIQSRITNFILLYIAMYAIPGLDFNGCWISFS